MGAIRKKILPFVYSREGALKGSVKGSREASHANRSIFGHIPSVTVKQ